MSRVKFTEKSVAKLRAPAPSGRQQLHWDLGLPGFGLLVSGVSDARTWIVKAAGNAPLAIGFGQHWQGEHVWATLVGPVTRGLDPRVHPLRKDSLRRDGLPGQARQ